MENYKIINKQLIEQNREMRIRLGQEREQCSYMCTKLIEERTMRIELQQKLTELHAKLFNDAIRMLCPDSNAIDVLVEQLGVSCQLNDRDDSIANHTPSTASERRNQGRSSTSTRTQRRSSAASSGSQRSSLGRFSSNIDVPISPTRRRYSIGRPGLRLSGESVQQESAEDPEEVEGEEEEEEEDIDTEKELTPRKCSFPEEEEEGIEETGQYTPNRTCSSSAQQEEDDEEAEEETNDVIEWAECGEEDSDGENYEPPPSARTKAPTRTKRNAKKTAPPSKKTSPLTDLTNCRNSNQRNAVTRRKPKHREEYTNANESVPQVRLEASPLSRKHSQQSSMLEPQLPDESARQVLSVDSYSITNLDMQNLLCSTPNSTRLSANSFCAHLENIQQPSTIQGVNATTDYEASTLSSTTRPRRHCTPKTLMEPSLRAKLRNDNGTTSRNERKSRTKK